MLFHTFSVSTILGRLRKSHFSVAAENEKQASLPNSPFYRGKSNIVNEKIRTDCR